MAGYCKDSIETNIIKMSGNRVNIFLVEDNELYALILDEQLKNMANIKLTTYPSAEEAIKNLHLSPDLIILDYYLEGMNGMDALKEIKNKNPNIPVIVLSSQKDTQVAVDTLQAGANNYFNKRKLHIGDLNSVINKVCSDKMTRENNFIFQLKISKQNIFILTLLLGLLGLIISIV